MTPLGWGWAGFVWVYALVWFLVNDQIKLLAYLIFDPNKTKTKSECKANLSVNLTQQIANRAFEIYEQRGHHSGQATEDWKQAEQEIKKKESHK